MGELSLAPPTRRCPLCGVDYPKGKSREHHRLSRIHARAKADAIAQIRAERQAKQPKLPNLLPPDEPRTNVDFWLEGLPYQPQPKPKGFDLQKMLDEHEEGVLYLVCQKGRYDSVVELAADYYEHTVEIQQDRVLEWNLIELLLDDLNKAGMVVYRMSATPLGEVMVRIRPTSKAYELITRKYQVTFNVGYIRIANVNETHSNREQPLHGVNDKTDYRNHGDVALGVGPCIREDFIDHCSACDHLWRHLGQLREMYGSDQL